MITTSEIKRGISIAVDGNLYQVVDVQHVKTKRSAVYKVKLRDLRAGHLIERSFKAGEKLDDVRVERRSMQFLYSEEDALTFMNTETYDQIQVAKTLLAEQLPYMKESEVFEVMTYGDEALGVTLPAAVELKIEEADPGVKGDTATGATKPATMETGLVVNVPLFLNRGDTIKISASSGEYIERTASA